jgi:hypothetical protein
MELLFFMDEKTKLKYIRKVVLNSMYTRKSNLAYYYLSTCFEIVSKRSDLPTWSFHKIGDLCDLEFNINVWVIQASSMSIIDSAHDGHNEARIQSNRIEPRGCRMHLIVKSCNM